MISLDKLRDAVTEAQVRRDEANRLFQEALASFMQDNGRIIVGATKRRGWPKGKKRGPRKPKADTIPATEIVKAARKARKAKKHPWRAKGSVASTKSLDKAIKQLEEEPSESEQPAS